MKDDVRLVDYHELQEHENRLSAEKKEKVIERNSCPRCNKVIFERHIKQHLKVCGFKKSLACPKCKKLYKHKHVLQAHIANCKK